MEPRQLRVLGRHRRRRVRVAVAVAELVVAAVRRRPPQRAALAGGDGDEGEDEVERPRGGERAVRKVAVEQRRDDELVAKVEGERADDEADDRRRPEQPAVHHVRKRPQR